MKYLVQLKYTNPSHEHVSLRRRVDTITRIVEAATEEEAINRSARQQRALGYLIQEAKVVDSDAKKEPKEQLDEAKKPDASLVMKDELKNKMISAKDKQTLGKVAALMASQKKKNVKEEVEQVDEANMRFDYEAAARPKSSDVKNFLNRDKNPRAAAASKKYIRRMTKLGGLGPNQTKKDTEAHMKSQFEEVVTEASREGKDVMRNMRASLKSMDLRHGVDSDKREAGYKMSPAVKAAQAKSDALSKVVKRPQAGTLAAAKMRNEELDQNETKGEKKIVKTSKKAAKAAEKMVNAAKGKMNKINIQPTMDLDIKSK